MNLLSLNENVGYTSLPRGLFLARNPKKKFDRNGQKIRRHSAMENWKVGHGKELVDECKVQKGRLVR